jgi:hypothetical protein
MAENLIKGEIIIRICPITRKAVLAQYEGNDNVLCLHNDTTEQDTKEVMKFLQPFLTKPKK